MCEQFFPVIGFDGEAYDTLYAVVGRMRGYGVTLTLEDGEEVEAVLSRLVYDDETARALVEFFRVTDDDYPEIGDIPVELLERAFATRIQVA